MRMEEPRILEARPEHAPQIERLEAHAFSIRPADWEQVRDLAPVGPPTSLVAVTDDRRVCGYASSLVVQGGAARSLWVLAHAVDPAWRGLGIGRLILGEVVRRSRAEGVKTFRLQVETSNAVALSLYESCGFRTVLRLPDAYGTGRDSFVMVLRAGV